MTHEGADSEPRERFLSIGICAGTDFGPCYRAIALSREIWLRVALGAVAVASGPLALSAWNHGMGTGGFASPVGGEKWFATRPGFFEAKGVKDPELGPTGHVFNWTEGEATLRFPRLERSRAAVVTVRIQGTNSSEGRPHDVAFSVDGVESQRLPIPTVPKRVSLELPKGAGRGAIVSLRVEGTQGVMVENVRLLPVGGSTLPLPLEALTALAFVALAAYVAMSLGGAPPWAALIAAAAQATLLSWVSMTGGAVLGRYSEALAWTSASMLVSVVATLALRDLRWRRAWIAVVWVTALKLSLLAHPQIVDGDATFHANNIARVRSGDWYFTSATPPPAISFPYPPGLSFASLPLSGLPRSSWVMGLRVLVLSAEVAAAYAFALSVAALATEGVGALTFVLLALAPEGAVVLFIGNLANYFADALMVFGCAWLIARRPILASLFLLCAFLSHFGTLLLGAPLSLLLALLRGEGRPLRRAAPVLVALVASFLLYYRRFMGVVVEAWDRITSLHGAAAVGPMTAPLSDKLTRMSGGESWWISAVILVSLAVGLATWSKNREPLARILAAWLLVAAAFGLLGLLTPVQVRSALSARAAVAALSASGIVALWSRGIRGRPLAAVLVGLTAISSWLIAVSFFPAKPA